MHEKIIILDFGSQTTQLIGRRIRELNTYCEILPYHSFPADDPTVRGVILSGSPYSVNNPDAFRIDTAALRGRYRRTRRVGRHTRIRPRTPHRGRRQRSSA